MGVCHGSTPLLPYSPEPHEDAAYLLCSAALLGVLPIEHTAPGYLPYSSTLCSLLFQLGAGA